MIFNTVKKSEKLLKELYDIITQKQLEYDGSIEKYKELELLFNKYYDLRKKLESKTKQSYYRSFDGPAVYLLNYDPHIIEFDQNTLDNISKPKKAYTRSEAYDLLEWTISNTRRNMEMETRTSINNMKTTGLCGFSQFSTLYPLQQLGLKVTYNNVGQYGSDYRHAFGTVTIPIIQDDNKIKDTTYIIDATYSQFFQLDTNVDNCVEKMAGYYMIQNDLTKKFAERLLNDGYIECNETNLTKYAYGFLAASNKEIQDVNIIFKEESPSSYDKEEFDRLGYNLEINKNKKKL